MEKNVRSNPFGQKKADSGSNPYNETTTNQTKPPTKKPIENKEHREQHTHTSSNVNKMPDTDSGSLESFRKEYESLKQFNCSKNFLRATCEKFPANSNLIKESSFPLGLVINPCSTLEPDLPTVNYGESEIPRCNSSQCRAYLNPFVKWVDGGDKWICNLCKNVNTTESYYYGKLDKSGMRSDYREKADLCNGSYEFIANKTYMKKDKALSSPTYIFLIDVSQMSSQNGFLSAVIESIKSAINDDLFPYNERTKIGFITYDNSVQFYLMNPGSTQPQMLCVSDENIFLPSTLDSLIVSLDSSKEILINTLDSIASSFVSSSCKDSQKIFTAINAGYLLAKSTGGKLLVFNASQSMTILNKMKTPNVVNIPKDEAIYSPTDDKQLSTMGINMTNENISLDLFIACESYVNLITLNQLCEYTNGNLYFYKNFRLEAHYKNIFNQMRKCISRTNMFEAVVRTRFSRGFRISSFVTPVLISNNDLLICSNLDSDQSYTVGIDLSDDPNQIQDNIVYIQTAVLYTHPGGTRRIRVHNSCYPTSARLNEVYESIDTDVLAVYYMKQTIDKILKTKKISNSVLSTESAYKAFTANVLSQLPTSKRELPENLSYLPLYLLGILKHRVCCKDELERKFDVDLSNFLRVKIQKMNYSDVLSFIYPRIYSLHQIIYDENIGNYDENQIVHLPQLTNTLFSALENDGVYLIDNGYVLILYTKYEAHSKLISSLFGVEDLSKISLPIFEENFYAEADDVKQRVINIVEYIRSTKSLFQNLIFIFEGTDGERIVKESLIEDNFCPWMPIDYKTFYANSVEVSTSYRPGLR